MGTDEDHAAVPAAAARLSRPRRVSRAQVRRLVRHLPLVRDARGPMDRVADERRRRRLGMRKSMLPRLASMPSRKTSAGLLKLCQALKRAAAPSGDGARTRDWRCQRLDVTGSCGASAASSPTRTTRSRSTRRRRSLRSSTPKQLYQTFVPGTLSWLDPSNNKAFLAGEISLTVNGISIYYAAKTSPDPKMNAIAADIQHAFDPSRPDRQARERRPHVPGLRLQYSKYPNAAKEYLRFMMEKEQYAPWQSACIGYISHPLHAYESNSVWTADPQHAFFRDVVKTMRPLGYAGKLGAGVRGDHRGLRRRRHVRRSLQRAAVLAMRPRSAPNGARAATIEADVSHDECPRLTAAERAGAGRAKVNLVVYGLRDEQHPNPAP